MAQQILLPNEFNIDNVNFLPPKKNTMGGQNVLLTYGEPDSRPGPLVFQTPRMRLPFGFDKQEPDSGGATKYSINASLAHGDGASTGLTMFTENIRALDSFITDKSVEFSEKWFGKPLKAEVLSEFYRSCEKKPKAEHAGKWASTLKLKLPFRDSKAQFEVYDDKKKKIEVVDESGNPNLECFQKGSEVVCLVQCTGMWFMGKTQFGIGWKVLQVKVFQTNKLVGYSIVDDDEPAEESDAEEEDIE